MGRAELAKKIGKNNGYSYIAELERPEGMKSSTKLHLIANALGVNVNWLETGKGERRPGEAHASVKASSHLLRPDPAIVREANAHLTHSLADPNDDGLAFDVDTHAELFSLAYLAFSDTTNKIVQAELAQEITMAIRGYMDGKVQGKVEKAPRRRAGKPK